MDAVLTGIEPPPRTSPTPAGTAAAEAIRTTDTVSRRPSTPRRDGWTIGGMAKGAGDAGPGVATMLVVITTDAVVGVGRPGCRAAHGHRLHLRPHRLRRLHVHQRHGAAAVVRGIRRRARPGGVLRGRSPRSAPTSPGSCSPTPRVPPTTSRSGSSAATRPMRSTVARASLAATCSSARCSATTRTGAGCLRRRYDVPRDFDPDQWTSPSTASDVFLDGQHRRDRSEVDLSGREVLVEVAPARRATRPRRSGPMTSPMTTSKRTRSTRHDRCRRTRRPS